MSLSISIVKRAALGSGAIVVADVTFDNSYPTGGLSLTASDLGLQGLAATKPLDYVRAEQKGVASRICQYDPATAKLKLFTALGTEAANLSDQSSIVVRMLAVTDPAGIAA